MVMPPTIEVASLGMWDSLILLVMALVVFGPRRLPEIGRKIGKVMYEVRKASNDFKFQMEEELRNVEEADRRKKDEERLSALALAAPAASAGTDLDSQVPEAGPGAPSSEAPGSGASQESPYPDEAVYPAVVATAPEAQAAVTYPQIQPPSTGAPVAAARPGSLTEQVKEPGSNHA
ncbi:MAG: twin-arginine translocase TatA/TatE family subunit [Terracidiphilus sp.]|jgi:sec-independent protein translocase protein TatB